MLVNRRELRIEWGDCDPAGIVYFPRYFEFFDASTVALFEAAGLPKKRQMLKDFKMAGFPMVDVRAKFHIPSWFGDVVVIESTIAEWRRSSFDVQHRLYKGDALAVEGFETRVWTVPHPDDPDRIKAEPIPETVKARFA